MTHEKLREEIRRNRELEERANEEYHDRFEQRAEVEERIRKLEAKLAAEQGDKVHLKAQIRQLEIEHERLTVRIQELEAELDRTRTTLLRLSDESSQINERRVDYLYEWARLEEYRAIILERILDKERRVRSSLEEALRVHNYVDQEA